MSQEQSQCVNGVCWIDKKETAATAAAPNVARSVRYLTEFRKQLVAFLDELIQQFPTETDLIVARIFIKDRANVEDLMGRFIRDILPHRERVQQRDSSFFLEHSLLYSDAASDKVDHFQALWKSDRLDEQDRDAVWRWMDVFVRMAQRYATQFGYVSGWAKPTAAVQK